MRALRQSVGLTVPATVPCEDHDQPPDAYLLGATAQPSRVFRANGFDVYAVRLRLRHRATLIALYDRVHDTHRFLGYTDGDARFALESNGLIVGFTTTLHHISRLNDGVVVIDTAHATMHLVLNTNGPSLPRRPLPRHDHDDECNAACRRSYRMRLDGTTLVFTGDGGEVRYPMDAVTRALAAAR